jgi:diguanylate cyclase (GGDEF)-like protein/PAS domain S-box-containing protein
MGEPAGDVLSADSDEKFRVIFECVGDGILVWDAETGVLTDVNPAACAMFGYRRDKLIGRTVERISAGIPPYTAQDATQWLREARSGGVQSFEWRCKARSGRLFWAEVSLRCVPFGGREVGLAIVRDITERKRKEDEVALEARQDALTGLPNRRDFDVTLEQEIARCQRYGATLCAAMADIDHFKSVNDTFGHPVGDIVLKSLADFMRNGLRRIDYIARWGGEEFTILFPETGVDVAEDLLNRLRIRIAQHIIPEIGRSVTLSFGVTAYGLADMPEDLVNRMDQALYQSKQAGRNRVTKI